MPKAKASKPIEKPKGKIDDTLIVPLILAILFCLAFAFAFLGGPKLPGTGAPATSATGMNNSTGANNTTAANASQNATPFAEPLKITGTTPYNGYLETNREFCRNAGGAAIVRMYALTTCPHCTWEEPVLRSAVSKFGSQAELRIYELDNARPSDSEINMFYERSPRGGVPLIVIGCKYHRVGTSEAAGTDVEKLAIERLLCKELGESAPSFCYVS